MRPFVTLDASPCSPCYDEGRWRSLDGNLKARSSGRTSLSHIPATCFFKPRVSGINLDTDISRSCFILDRCCMKELTSLHLFSASGAFSEDWVSNFLPLHARETSKQAKVRGGEISESKG